jgi:uncharacterized repeat protein (TIGR03803 family)
MTKLNGWQKGVALFLLCAATAIVASAQTFTSLFSFDGTNGFWPDRISLVQGANGELYGTTYYGGGPDDTGLGTIFKITKAGTLTTLYSFDDTDNGEPDGPLVLATDGNFYGTTFEGGANGGYGTVFQITPNGTVTTLHSFAGTDGSLPLGGLIQASNGAFYGTTELGGASNLGTVYKITPDGELTTLHSFDGIDGTQSWAGLTQATNGNLYGTARSGGTDGVGTLFRITLDGTFETLFNFGGSDGANPSGGLVQGADGNLYGTTDAGTFFRMTLGGTLTTLCTCIGGTPVAGVIQGTDGNFYGTTIDGGANGDGTVFEITTDGTITTLHTFDGTDGSLVYGGLVQATTGIFYGTTEHGGANVCAAYGCGTVYSLSTGLGPFVAFVHSSGKAGRTGGILGQGFTGTTAVSLNAIPASFTVVSDTFIRATVPEGATTGYVTVTTPTGVLTSNVPFHVIP